MENGAKLIKKHYHAASWNEPLIMEMGNKGERGIIVSKAEDEIIDLIGNAVENIPNDFRRKEPPKLPEMAQPQILRHYMRLSQMCLGADLNIDLGQGTCTMKYSPKVNEVLASMPEMTELHPSQDDETVQGLLEIMYRFEECLREISGLDKFTFQPGAGAQGIYTNACIIRAYHESRGEAEQRDEIITTIFSHPADAATPATAGFKVIMLMPDESGYPDLEALKAAVSERTAGIMITNPEDTGIYNPRIKEYVDIVHKAGGLCSYDQANANGILGICRAKEAGFDLCHFNVHKTFSSPHGCMGPACGAVGVTKELAKFLPVPILDYINGKRYELNYNRPDSIGKIRGYVGNMQVILRAYAWVMALGADGLKTVAETSILNNNYLSKKILSIPGVDLYYAKGKLRLDQVRYSWNTLKEETGVGTTDVKRRMVDFGIQGYHESHHPYIIPEPFTLEPTETYSKDDLDEYIEIFEHISSEAYTNSKKIIDAPNNCAISRMDERVLDDPDKWAMTWRAYQKKRNNW